MTRRRALTIAIDCIRRVRHDLAPEANIARQSKDPGPSGERSLRQWQDLTTAIQVLETMR